MISKAFKLKKRPRNFVIAMAVFGNSNSLPISLVLSLSHTISGLHWDRIPGDNDNEVGARGILYLLIFQQLGQLVRWTWGYNVLLAPAEAYEDESQHNDLEDGRQTGDSSISADGTDCLIDFEDDQDSYSDTEVDTPTKDGRYVGSPESSTIDGIPQRHVASSGEVLPTPADGNVVGAGPGNLAGHTNGRTFSKDRITSFPAPSPSYR